QVSAATAAANRPGHDAASIRRAHPPSQCTDRPAYGERLSLRATRIAISGLLRGLHAAQHGGGGMKKMLVTPGGISVAAVQQQMQRQLHEARHTPRIIFAMDATASREATWEMASKLHREMGAVLGNLNLQLVFFRGGECKASRWV